MAHRILSLGGKPLIFFSLTQRVRLNARNCFSISLTKGAGHPSAFRHPHSSSHQTRSKSSDSKCLTGVESKEHEWNESQGISKAKPSSIKIRHTSGKAFRFTKGEKISINPGHTLFTSPEATKTAVLDAASMMGISQDPGDAAVILASPRHASWLTDTEFMTGLTRVLLGKRYGAQGESSPISPSSSSSSSFHTLTAVVDGLYPKIGSQEMQEGLSVQFGSLHRLLPGLWDEAPIETPGIQKRPLVGPDIESAHVSVVLSKPAKSRTEHTVTLPLANTLFHNGQRTTLMASEWLVDSSKDQPVSLLRMTPKRAQKIDVSISTMPARQKDAEMPRMLCPLVPITHPRRIVEGLGNILAKVDVDGQVSPASKELQVNIPHLLQVRQSWSKNDPKSARVGVWALIVPESLFVHRTVRKTSDKLAFEMKSGLERMAWRQQGILGEMLFQGGRLHQILSGGGEWGAKASLLSLDPQTSYGKESEDDELERFQRSFHGQDTGDGATARPGDYVQFFVEGDMELPSGSVGRTSLAISRARYPSIAFGVGECGKAGYTATTTADASVTNPRRLVQLADNHFGAFSAEGMYLETERRDGKQQKLKTKVNVPGTTILPSSRVLARA